MSTHALGEVSARRQAERRGSMFGRAVTRGWLISERPHLGEINRRRKDRQARQEEAAYFAQDIVRSRWERAFIRGFVRAAQSLLRAAAHRVSENNEKGNG